ncbi:ATP-binding protein [Streptomyces sp. N2-109]|uniref:ATP-binding protein n=1 Tax=Streptomyces gossypii TaxID=2883101 RepID=A0ABT2JSY5_9ACTN|nr:ATP-binding protein [Streptomyces gossypii]MCT2590876.1 ATP-binding protein [Streptomyces gossypii]
MYDAAVTTARHRYPRTPHTVSRSRANLRAQLRAWGLSPDDVATAELVLSELVTNAVQHAGNPPGRQVEVRFTLTDAPTLLRLEVSDACTALPRPRTAALDLTPDPDAESGRGLLLVTALADGWGVTPRPHGIGKTVWAELKLTQLGDGQRQP